MQALIDFDGWRKWKDFASDPAVSKPAEKPLKEKKTKRISRASVDGMPPPPPPPRSPQVPNQEDGGGAQSSAVNSSEGTGESEAA